MIIKKIPIGTIKIRISTTDDTMKECLLTEGFKLLKRDFNKKFNKELFRNRSSVSMTLLVSEEHIEED